MPCEHFLEYRFPVVLDHIPVARDNLLKVPAVDAPYTLIETLPIRRARHIPEEPLLPSRRADGILKGREKSRQNPVRCFLPRPAVLLVRRQIEHHVRLDKRLVWLVAEH